MATSLNNLSAGAYVATMRVDAACNALFMERHDDLPVVDGRYLCKDGSDALKNAIAAVVTGGSRQVCTISHISSTAGSRA
ncbi:hypothetical protein VB147_16660 [Xanthomonas floridensis]|nr:hypothetical protein [Xanthomonas floridensis]